VYLVAIKKGVGDGNRAARREERKKGMEEIWLGGNLAKVLTQRQPPTEIALV
jgi:hypothetical protein